MKELDLILPVYNPPAGWEKIVIDRFLSLQTPVPDLSIKLILVDDGSIWPQEDSSRQRLKNAVPNLQFVAYPENRGKGFALRTGVRQSEGDFIVYTDIDFPYTEESMVNLIRRLTENADVVIGTRNEDYYAQIPSTRKRISILLRKVNARLLRLRVNDTQAGLKGFRKSVKEIFLSTTIDRYLFDLEFIYLLSRKKNLTVTGIPVTLRPGISFSHMNWRILIQESMNFLKILFVSREP